MSLDENVVLRGEEELAERAGHLLTGARREFSCAAADPATWMLPGVRARLLAARSAPVGITIRKLYTPRALADEESERLLLQGLARGARIRITQAPLPHETIIIDRRLAVLAGPPVQGVRDYTVVRSPGVVRNIASLYEAAWDTAADLADHRRTRPPALSAESRAILRLLAEGLKDETAARRLDLSLRTYRRRVAEILTLLDADSRFQAGLRAHEFGLLDGRSHGGGEDEAHAGQAF
ncbi:DNA-binding response regulator [Actinomadura kijaniata]|uniref:helix-turn-helix transcriptional regulator n=1 Tax=Actinomadura kijaniata TaxID=46161 RepID=UPI003F1CBD53